MTIEIKVVGYALAPDLRALRAADLSDKHRPSCPFFGEAVAAGCAGSLVGEWIAVHGEKDH